MYKKRRKREVAPISDFLKEYVASSKKLKTGLDKVQVRDAWFKVMGNTIGKYTTDVHLDRSTMYVQLSSAPLRQELSYGKEKIRVMMNEELERELIEKVVLC